MLGRSSEIVSGKPRVSVIPQAHSQITHLLFTSPKDKVASVSLAHQANYLNSTPLPLSFLLFLHPHHQHTLVRINDKSFISFTRSLLDTPAIPLLITHVLLMARLTRHDSVVTSASFRVLFYSLSTSFLVSTNHKDFASYICFTFN